MEVKKFYKEGNEYTLPIAGGGEYSAGDGIKIEDNVISNPYKPQVVTQEEYDELTDKTGFYLIRD